MSNIDGHGKRDPCGHLKRAPQSAASGRYGEARLVKISEAERDKWRAFWADIEALRAEI